MKLKRIRTAAVMAAVCAVSACGCTSNGSTGGTVDVSTANGKLSTTDAQGNVEDVTLKNGDKIAVFEVEGYGTIKAKLFPEIAPVGVANFEQLAQQGYFNGKTIHRVVADFMLQGGSLNGDGTGGDAVVGDTGDFGTEIHVNARHFYGALCYANALGMNSTQFYIVNNKLPQTFDEIDPAYVKYLAEQYGALKTQATEGSLQYQSYDSMEKYYSNLAELVETATDKVKEKYKAVGGTPSLDGGYTVFGQVYEGFEVIDAISACEVKDNGNGEVSKPVEEIIIKSVTVTAYTE